MENRLKQRMVGAFVLTLLAIIMLPMLLDGTAEEQAKVIASIPDAPKIEVKRTSILDLKRQMRQMEQESAAKLPKEVVDEDNYELEASFSLDKNALPISWSLQLGSFKNKENATSLRAELRAANYHSYILQAKTSDGETFRVLVGPMLKKSALLKLGEQIDANFNVKGQLVRYRIEDDAGQLGG